MTSTGRGWHWWMVRLQFGVVSALYTAVNVGVWYVVIIGIVQIVRAGDFWIRHPVLMRVWWTVADAAYRFSHASAVEQLFVVAAFAGFAWLMRRAYIQWRYGIAGELAAVRRLLVVDPQMALVRQRLILEAVVTEMTEPMNGNGMLNLNDRLKALAMLGKLPAGQSKLARSIRRNGNEAAHPHDHADRRGRTVTDRGAALEMALTCERDLKLFLRWYRTQGRRRPMTREDWDGIRHAFASPEPFQAPHGGQRHDEGSGKPDEDTDGAAAAGRRHTPRRAGHRVASRGQHAVSRHRVVDDAGLPRLRLSGLDASAHAAMAGDAAVTRRVSV